jgi:integrating conjugative element protein (TIGR03758 family)
MLTEASGALAAVQAASGVSPDKVSLTIRTILLVAVLVWAAWIIGSKLHHLRHHGLDELDTARCFFSVLFVVMLILILVQAV